MTLPNSSPANLPASDFSLEPQLALPLGPLDLPTDLTTSLREIAPPFIHDPELWTLPQPEAGALTGELGAGPLVGSGLVIIDAALPDYTSLLSGLQPGLDVLVLDPHQDGIQEITAALTRYTNLESLHIFSHGFSGGVQMGRSLLSTDTLSRYADALQQWAGALSAEADILLYGCDVAGLTGMADPFLGQLADLTGADIAASSDLTGAGGDWDLEVATGTIETNIALNAATQAAYGYSLATVVVSNTNDLSNGNVTSIATLIANDGGDGISLREAITAANNTAGDDIINFALPVGPQTINLNAILPTLTGNVEINNTTGAANLTIQANTLGAFNIFQVNAGVTARFDHLTIANGVNGIANLGTIDLSNSVVSGNTGIGVGNGGTISNLTNTTITNNQGNGLFNGSGRTIANIANSTISNNLGVNGGIFNQGTIATLANTTIANNQANGIENNNTITTLTNTTISGNQLRGIFNKGTIITLSNSTISGNTGNGIENSVFLGAGQIDTINNVTIAANTNNGILNAGTITTLSNSILAGNTGGNLAGIAPGTDTNNLDGATLAAAGLGPLADNGGPTRTHALLSGSAAIDAAGAGATATDQRGMATFNGIRDRGAFEFTSSPIVTLAGTNPKYAENQAPVLIADAATINDADSTDFDTGTLTVRFTAGGVASDRLTVVPDANVTLNGQRISVAGTEIGTFRGGLGTAEDLVFTLNANATPAATQALLRRIAYSNAGEALPATGTRTVEFVLTDGDGNTSIAVTRNISIITATNNNDAPFVGNQTVLYDPATGTIPNPASLIFTAVPPAVTPLFGGGVTNVNTTLNSGILAGFTTNPLLGLVLDRAAGYTLSFAAQVLTEAREATANKNNDGKDDRAGFSVLVISSDNRAIELGFWTDRIWAQDDGTTQTNPSLEPDTAPNDNFRTLFTQAEFNNTVNTTVLTNYDLVVQGNLYTLFANGTEVLSGRLRDYTAFAGPIDPYQTPNLIFFGDNTPSANASFSLGRVAVTPNAPLPAQTVNEDTPVVVTSIQIADVDAAGNPVTVTLNAPNGTLTVNNAVANGVPAGNITNNGTATVTLVGTVSQINTTLANATGLTYQGGANFNGPETLTVTVDDGGNTGGTAQTASRTKTINVTAVNDAPTVTAPANLAVTEDAATAITGISFADPDAGANNVIATFTVGAGTLAATTGGGVTVGGTATNLTLTGTVVDINAFLAANSLTYTTALNDVAAQTLGVSLNDNGFTGTGGAQNSGITNVALNVTAVNDAPNFTNAGNQNLAAGTNTAQTVANWANTFVFGPADEAGQAVLDFQVVVTNDPSNIFTIAPDVANDGTLTYTPNGTPGTATVEVRLQDNGGVANGGVDLSPIATFTITVSANTPPTLATATLNGTDGNLTVDEGTAVILQATATDAEADTLTFTLDGDNAGAIPGAAGSIRTSNPVNRTTPDNGNIIYTFQVSDGTAAPVTVNRTLTINNVAPTITEGATIDVTLSEDSTPTPFALTLNATDPGTADLLTWSIFTAATNGTASVSATPTGNSQVISYTPAANFNGLDSFVVRVSDDDGGIADIIINVTVQPINDPPTAIPTTLNTLEDTAVEIDLRTLVSDQETLPANFTFAISNPNNGAVELLADGFTARFTPAANFNGTASFNYTGTDGGDGAAPALTTAATAITVNVAAVNDAPTFALPAEIPVVGNAPTPLNTLALSDIDSTTDPVTVTLTVTAGELTATSGSGVIVTGTPTNLTLTGSLADINSFLANGGLSFTPPSDDLTPQPLAIQIDEGGAMANQTVNLVPTATPVLVSVLPSLVQLAGQASQGIYEVVGGAAGQLVSLAIDWVTRDALFDNEIGFFLVDDAQGTVDGVAPGDPNYLQTAINSASRQVIFQSGQGAGVGKDILLPVGSRLIFYLVQNTTTGNWLATNPQNSSTGNRILLSKAVVNPNSLDHAVDTVLDNGVLELAWEDIPGGGDLDFNDVVIRVSSAVFQVPGTLGQPRNLTINLPTANAQFQNELGYFFVDDFTGRIGSLSPGDAGYAQAAFAAGNFRPLFQPGQGAGGQVQVNLAAGRLLGWYLIQNRSSTDFLFQNPTNSLALAPVAFFSFAAANPDGVDHFRRISGTTFAWEDLIGGGDRDFDDAVLQVQ